MKLIEHVLERSKSFPIQSIALGYPILKTFLQFCYICRSFVGVEAQERSKKAPEIRKGIFSKSVSLPPVGFRIVQNRTKKFLEMSENRGANLQVSSERIRPVLATVTPRGCRALLHESARERGWERGQLSESGGKCGSRMATPTEACALDNFESSMLPPTHPPTAPPRPSKLMKTHNKVVLPVLLDRALSARAACCNMHMPMSQRSMGLTSSGHPRPGSGRPRPGSGRSGRPLWSRGSREWSEGGAARHRSGQADVDVTK